MKTKILFIEDERWGVSPYFRELEKNGFECLYAKDGDEALRYLKNNMIQMISMDISFPPGKKIGNNVSPIEAGLKLLEKIRANQIRNCEPDITIVILTAVQNYEIEAKIRSLNISAYLKKPIGFGTVINQLNAIKERELKDV